MVAALKSPPAPKKPKTLSDYLLAYLVRHPGLSPAQVVRASLELWCRLPEKVQQALLTEAHTPGDEGAKDIIATFLLGGDVFLKGPPADAADKNK